MINFEWKSSNSEIKGFRYLWLKQVTGFNPKVHCARCLNGEYSKDFSPRMPVNSVLSLDYQENDVLYFCGVSIPYKWENNLHLAGIVSNGEQSEVIAYNGDILTINGLKKIDFDDAVAKAKYPNLGREYLTCRNFQFAAQVFQNYSL